MWLTITQYLPKSTFHLIKKRKILALIILVLATLIVKSQTYPSYGPEIEVTINGLIVDAMEPFISDDENYLFFNNLNSGGTTKLFYATKVNDSTFNYVGELNGTNQLITPYLDGFADMDSQIISIGLQQETTQQI